MGSGHGGGMANGAPAYASTYGGPALADAVVLAGGDGTPVDASSPIKGLVPVLGRPMVEWVVDALRAAGTVRRIVVVLPTDQGLNGLAEKVDAIVVSDGRFIDNALAGFSALDGDLHAVWATGDIPAITPAAIDEIVTRTINAGADFSYPLISEAAMTEQFPGSVRTYFKIAAGTYTGGNVVVTPPTLDPAALSDLFQQFFDARKSPVKTLKIVGAGFAAKLALGKLDTADIERKLSGLFGAPCAAIYDPHPSVGADVDKPIDRVVVEQVLRQRG